MEIDYYIPVKIYVNYVKITSSTGSSPGTRGSNTLHGHDCVPPPGGLKVHLWGSHALWGPSLLHELTLAHGSGGMTFLKICLGLSTMIHHIIAAVMARTMKMITMKIPTLAPRDIF